MTSKTKLGIFSIAGIAAIAVLASGLILDQTQNQVDTMLRSDTPYPYEIPFWQGVPTLAMNYSPSDRTDYHELKGDEFTWLQRLVENSETIVNDKEIKEFFDVSEDNYLYKINGVVYTIHYTDNPTVRLDQHYVKVIPLDNLSLDARTVSSTENTWLQKGLSNPYKWVEVSSTELADYKNFSKDGRNISIDGTGYNLRYIGADTPQLEQKEYKDTLNKSIGIFEEDSHE